MHHSKDRVFTLIMMLIFSRCTVSFNNYSTLYMTPVIQVLTALPTIFMCRLKSLQTLA